ncbi:MAG: lysoplasmalogenase [Clostridiales bacterium]|jgi:uncharacterized membrane protein YhhN|nr:lysoplasmalogenase [Clostridiales bacterium]
MTLPIIFAAAAALLLGAFLYFRDDDGSVKALYLKTAVSVLFIAVAVCGLPVSGGASVAPFFILITLGLTFGLLGDIFLDFKFVDKVNADAHTFAGMSVFAIGHILYIPAVIYFFALDASSVLISAAIALAAAAATVVVTVKLMKYNYGKFIVPAAVYSFLLMFFTAVSAAALIKSSSTEALLLTVGSIAFLLSDVVLSMQYFGGKKGRGYIVPNHILYYAAQFLIAFTLVIL